MILQNDTKYIMKSLALIFSACFMTTICFAKIPEKVINAFQLKYANATNVKWKNDVIYCTVTFDLMNAKYHATFDKKGEWLQSTQKLRVNELPEVVKKSFKKTKYASWSLVSCFEEYFPREQPRYHVRAAKSSIRRKDLVFDSQGKIVQGK
jgi:hypothetical protein